MENQDHIEQIKQDYIERITEMLHKVRNIETLEYLDIFIRLLLEKWD